MNREEAIEHINIAINRTWKEKKCNEILDALKQEPCEDCISREAVLDLCDSKDEEYKVRHLKEDVECLPPVTLQPCGDCISRQAVLEAIKKCHCEEWVKAEIGAPIEALSPAAPSENPNKWIPVKWHEITDEKREREGYPKEWVNHVDCVMPEDGQEILITVKGRKGNRWVEKDTNYIDDGFYLDSGYDWVEDIEAWCELPEPYKASPTGAESEG